VGLQQSTSSSSPIDRAVRSRDYPEVRRAYSGAAASSLGGGGGGLEPAARTSPPASRSEQRRRLDLAPTSPADGGTRKARRRWREARKARPTRSLRLPARASPTGAGFGRRDPCLVSPGRETTTATPASAAAAGMAGAGGRRAA
jgi:hypothetical protein